jgi:hypothetical protein
MTKPHLADTGESNGNYGGGGVIAAFPDRRSAATTVEEETKTWDFLERLQATYRELVIILLGHIQGSDMLTAAERADQLERLLDELHDIANALRDTSR